MPNKIYINAETAIAWTVGGTPDIDLGGLAADAVRVGERRDLGSAARAEWYEWRVNIDGFDTVPVVGERVDLYLATSDGTIEDGDVGALDAVGATVSLPNLTFLGSATVQTTTAADELHASGLIRIAARYVSPVVHNNTADALLGTADAHTFILTPIPPEIQG